MTLASSVLEGSRLALSRLLTQIENDTPEGRQALSELFPHTGRAHLVGVTGAPGTGKSSLVNQLARYYRNPSSSSEVEQKRVAVIAIDPSSPFTGGAILGDRIRMRDLAGDAGVFIRSMASRGSLGGLAAATSGVASALDAAGYEIILIETVGAGQAEVDVAGLAHTTLVVEAPGMGDDIQAIKAGILEVADILVINKADRPGVENTERALRGMLELAHPTRRIFKGKASAHHRSTGSQQEDGGETQDELWIPTIQRTVATEGAGIPELAGQIHRHAEYLRRSGDWQKRELSRLQAELEALIRDSLVDRWRSATDPQAYQAALEALLKRRLSPRQASESLLEQG